MAYNAEIIQGITDNKGRMPNGFPAPFDRWIVSSAWQKSIRRGDTDTALMMTRGFLIHEPAYIWKRIFIIALEDVGLANIPLVNQILWVAGKQAWIKRIGEATLAEYLVTALCESAKDRNACEAVQVADKHPYYHHHRQTYPQKPFNELVSIASGDCLYTSTLSIWAMLGTKKFHSDHFYSQGYERDKVLEALNPAPETKDLFLLAWSKPAYGIPLGCLAQHPILQRLQPTIQREKLPPTEYEGVYPLYALDMYTRKGKQALSLWGQQNQPLYRFLSRHLPKEQWNRYLGNILFVLESEKVNLRLSYQGCEQPVRDTLEAELATESFPKAMLEELTLLMQNELSGLNAARRQCFRG